MSLGGWFVGGPISAADDVPKKEEPKATAEPARQPPKLKDFAEVTKDAEKIEGLFTLYSFLKTRSPPPTSVCAVA
jgi:hypothetical protein